MKSKQCRKGLLFLGVAWVWICDVHPVSAQKNTSYFPSSTGNQYGFALKAYLEYSKLEKLTFRVGFSGGVGASLGGNWLYPTLNSDLMLYSGGMGSNRPGVKKFINSIELEWIFSYTVTMGTGYRLRENSRHKPGIRNYPLYYFKNHTMPALQNPYKWSASFGGNYVWFLTRKLNNKQSVGFINVHMERFQVNYINDGPPFLRPIGDRHDRYHTGGALITYHGSDKDVINLVELSYNKFTGYTPSAYELSNKLGASYIFYRDIGENFYNKSALELNVANTARGYGMHVTGYNYTSWDIQHMIHSNMYYSLHLVPYKGSVAGAPTFYYQQNKIGLE
jgi:hypothetical protein